MSSRVGQSPVVPAKRTLISLSALAIASLWPSGAMAQGASQVSPEDAEAPAESNAEGEAIIVTGSRLARSTFDTPSPVTVLGGEDFEELQITNVGEGIAELPAFRPSNSPATNGFGSFNVGAQIVNLRGLGVTRNLVLVDGRRFAPTTREGSVDLNFIPSTLVSRVEVVTGGASAAYGSDALAGVVNVILDTRLEGLKAQVDFGLSQENDAGNLHGGIGYGSAFAGGAGHFVVGGEYSNQEGAGNCLTRDYCRLGGVFTNTGYNTPPGTGNGLPNYIRGNENVGYFISPSGVINGFNNPSPATAAIRNMFGVGGITFAPDGTPLPARQGSRGFGNFQLGGDIIPGYSEVDLVAPVERYSLFGHADYDFSDSLRGFVEGSYGRVDGGTFQSSFFGSFPIFADNPYIPAEVRDRMTLPAGVVAPGGVTAQPTGPYSFDRPATTQVAFNLGRMLTDVGRGFSRSVADTYRGTAGLSGEFGNGFSWDAYYQYGLTERQQTVDNQLILGDPANSVDNPATIANSNANFRFAVDAVIDPATGQPTCRALLSPRADVRAAAAGCVPINLFGAGNVTPNGRDYIYGTLVEDITLNQHVVAANVRGDLGELWAGPLSFALGGEYRVDAIDVVHDPLSNKFAYFQNFGADFNGETKVLEGYVEAELPLITDQPWTESLTINGAARQAHYDISGFGSYLRAQSENSFDATTWKVSVLWEPVDWVRLRATRSRDVRAPNFAELFLASASSFTPINNLFNPGVLAPPPSLLGGGNPDARPEKADTTTFGVVLAPTSGFLDGFRFSADHYDIIVKDYLSGIPGGAQNIINKCFAGFSEVCTLINRGAGITTGQNITEIRNITTNLEQIRSRGIDFEADYRIPLAGDSRIQLRAIATYVQELSSVSLGDVIDRAGQTGGVGGMSAPEWLLNGTATYSTPRFSMTLQARYIDSGLYDAQRIGPDDPDYAPTLINSITDNTVESRVYFNLFGSFFLDPDRRFEVFGSINNLLDKAPPPAPETQFYTNPVYFDTLGRYFRVGARVKL